MTGIRSQTDRKGQSGDKSRYELLTEYFGSQIKLIAKLEEYWEQTQKARSGYTRPGPKRLLQRT